MVKMVLAFVACLCMTIFAQGPESEYVEPKVPGEDMSGSQIYREVRDGAYDDQNDVDFILRGNDLYNLAARPLAWDMYL